MVIWGAIWGAVLGLLWRGYGDSEFQMVLGAILGAAAGWSLRSAVRREVARTQAGPAQAIVPAPTVAAATAAAPTAVAPVPAPVVAAPTTVVAEAPAPRPRAPVKPAEPDFVTRLFWRARDWLFGGNTVVRMGVLVLFVGLAFLAKYAVENALLPPQLRLAAIGAAGIALFVFGLRAGSKAPAKRGFALTLQGAGVAVLYLTVFAAFRLYQYLPPAAAFGALGLVCLFSTIIALAQNALPLAFIGFAGGFAAPLLVSTGQGSHVGLFGYYLLLGVAIAAIAWVKAWRALNLLGFFATFGVATLWGVLKYSPADLESTEPFLVAFFLLYLLAALFYALRHGDGARKAIDATLLFGNPVVAFGLQAGLLRDVPYATAFSSLALGALYLVLGWWLVRRQAGDRTVNQWLAECFAALALGFVTLAVPLALDGRWTSAVWAVEGAAVYWMGRRQGRWLARAAGLALQGLAALLYLEGSSHAQLGQWPLANPAFLGATMLAAAALAIAWWSRTPRAPENAGAPATAFAGLENALSPWLFWAGFLWWQWALSGEIGRFSVDAQGGYATLFDPAQRQLLHLLAWALSAFALHHLALPRRASPWPVAATPAWTVMPVMLMAAVLGMATLDHVFQSGGWLAWPLALLLHFTMLRHLDGGAPQAWWPWVHAGGVWLLVLLLGNGLVFAIGKAQLWQTAWATVILLVAATTVMLLLGTRKLWETAKAGVATAAYPLNRFGAAYLWRAAAPLAIALAAGTVLVAVHSRGDARPLPYLPLLNPTDLALALALLACARWLLRVRSGYLQVPAAALGPAPGAVLAGIAFIALNTVWLRMAHHYGHVAWDAHSLFSSFLVQAGFSILWTLLALVLMVVAHRQALRTPWMLGAGLLGLTVLKLFVIDLSNRGGSERIVVFIAVGLLMLVVGWFAPLPPARASQSPGGEGLQGAAT
ncbi:DUF2339 domain-containing protein [Ramlibacter sp. XY19]|uniref:DUF2339 domain-containing protein n=1 Tax=Ramlibacter paludis TaxID=2908000 RepID=UPI0023DCE389|nr:DUF2339 domain-containing protein [Ramlibacter paludis]MCG2591934.1 DUF2339 domain-containing protein [Ramlibacter paludis]